MDEKITLELLRRRLGEIMLKEDERYFDASGKNTDEEPDEYGKLNDPGDQTAAKGIEDECLTSEKLARMLEEAGNDGKKD